MMDADSCEYCEGTVREKVVKREAFKHRSGYVILEDVSIGVCDRCGSRYFSDATLELVETVASGKKRAERIQPAPLVHA